jgi:hypothetical protein
MPTASLGLTLTYPDLGARNWGTSFIANYTNKISEHDHTGSGKGLNIVSNALAANAVIGSKFRLQNNEPLRARNAANSADINLFGISTSDKFQVYATLDLDFLPFFPTYSAEGAMTFTSTTTTTAIYFQMGDFIWVSVEASGTIGGSPLETDIYCTLTGFTLGVTGQQLACQVTVPGSGDGAGLAEVTSTPVNSIRIRRGDALGSNWLAGTGAGFKFTGWIRLA